MCHAVLTDSGSRRHRVIASGGRRGLARPALFRLHLMNACLNRAQTRACKRKTLVLDLDETLVHSTLDGLDLPDFSFPVFFNGCARPGNPRGPTSCESYRRRMTVPVLRQRHLSCVDPQTPSRHQS